MSIIATVGHPKSNSFISLEELNALMNTHDFDWAGVPESEAERYAVISAAKISNVRYLGQPLYQGQRLAFPRKNDTRVSGGRYTDAGLTTVEHGHDTEACVIDYTPEGCRFSSTCFPMAGVGTIPALAVAIIVGGVTYTLVDTGLGVLTGGGYTGTVDYTTGDFTIAATPDSGSTATVSGYWLESNVVAGTAFVFDQQEYVPDLFKTGSVHLPQSDGTRDYLDIVSHNIVTGALTLSGRMSSTSLSAGIVFEPHMQTIKQAQFSQLLAERGKLDWDRRANRGIKKVKIGDTEVQYDEGKMPSKLRKLAGQYRLHELVMAMLAPYTIYGKMGVIYGEWNSSSAAE